MFTKAFWQTVAERALKSLGQGGVIALGMSDVGPGNLFTADARNVITAALSYAAISVFTSLSIATVSGDGPSLAPKAEAEVALQGT